MKKKKRNDENIELVRKTVISLDGYFEYVSIDYECLYGDVFVTIKKDDKIIDKFLICTKGQTEVSLYDYCFNYIYECIRENNKEDLNKCDTHHLINGIGFLIETFFSGCSVTYMWNKDECVMHFSKDEKHDLDLIIGYDEIDNCENIEERMVLTGGYIKGMIDRIRSEWS